jgi:hypothetical protein
MMDTFYRRMGGWLEAMLAEVEPVMGIRNRGLRAAPITPQIEGLMLLIGAGTPAELGGPEEAAIRQIRRLALAP